MIYINRDGIIAALKDFSDRKYQQRVWLSSSGPEVSSFTEDMCQLFDDTGLGRALEKGIVFGEEPDFLLRRLSAVLQMINPHKHPQEIIDDPRMDDVRLTSLKILELIK